MSASTQENYTVSFTCVATAVPAAEFTWWYTPTGQPPRSNFSGFPRISIESETNPDTYSATTTLSIIEVEFADRGTFACSAENDVGSGRATASLTVYGESL